VGLIQGVGVKCGEFFAEMDSRCVLVFILGVGCASVDLFLKLFCIDKQYYQLPLSAVVGL